MANYITRKTKKVKAKNDIEIVLKARNESKQEILKTLKSPKENRIILSKISQTKAVKTINRTSILYKRAIFFDKVSLINKTLDAKYKGYFMANNVEGAMKHHSKANKQQKEELITSAEFSA